MLAHHVGMPGCAAARAVIPLVSMRVALLLFAIGCSSTVSTRIEPPADDAAADAAATDDAPGDGAGGESSAGAAAGGAGAAAGAGGTAGLAGAANDAGDAAAPCNRFLCPQIQSTYPTCCTEDGYCGQDFGQGYCLPMLPKDADAGSTWLCSDSEPAGAACVCMRGTGGGKPSCDVTPPCCAYLPGLHPDPWGAGEVRDWCECRAFVGAECDSFHGSPSIAVTSCPPST